MRPVPPSALRQVQQFLATSAPPCDFAAHYDTLAPEAMVLIGSQALQARELGREVYAQRMRQFQEMAAPATVGPAFQLVLVQDWMPDEGGGVLLAGIKDIATKAHHSALFRLQGERLQVRAAVLGGKPLPKPAAVIARSAAEIAHWRPLLEGDVWPMHSLTLSALRGQPQASEPLLSLPEARFTCQNLGFCCEGIGKAEVGVHSNTVRALASVPWAEMALEGPSFRPAKASATGLTEAPWAFDGCDDGRCTARVNGRCSIHQAAGWQPITPCLVFPYLFIRTPDGVAVTTSFLCHSAGGNVGQPLAEQEADIQRRLAAVRSQVSTIGDSVPLVRGGPDMDWHAYRRLETQLLAILDDRTLGPLPDRLLAAHQLMVAVMTVFRYARHVDLAAIEHVLATPLPDVALVPSHYADELMALALKPRNHPGPLRPDRLFGDWHANGWHLGRGRPLQDALDDDLATRYLRTMLFRKPGLAVAGAAFVWSTVTWAFRAWERQARFLESATGKPVDRTLQLDVARHIDAQLFQSPFLTLLIQGDATYQRYTSPRLWLSLMDA
jgi:hypothetical protein